MTVVNFPRRPRQKDLFSKRWRQVEQRIKEIHLHIQLVAILRHCVRPDVLWRHVPNGEHRDKRTAAKLKAMGVLAGAADLEFHWQEVDNSGHKCRRVLHLELKRGNASLSESQVAYALAVRLLGDDYHVASTVDTAIQILGERGLIRSNVEVGGKRW